jgi:hypothetical protein
MYYDCNNIQKAVRQQQEMQRNLAMQMPYTENILSV